jgi:hypothetical protein
MPLLFPVLHLIRAVPKSKYLYAVCKCVRTLWRQNVNERLNIDELELNFEKHILTPSIDIACSWSDFKLQQRDLYHYHSGQVVWVSQIYLEL